MTAQPDQAGDPQISEARALPRTAPIGRRPYVVHDGPLFFAHRGGAKLAPENTLVAFEQGVSFGADCLELDIQMTSDGEVVVIHDPTVNRTTNGRGPVASYTLDQLRHLDAGYRFTGDDGQTYPFRGRGITIPTLGEVLERFPTLRINIDLKASDPTRERRLWDLIQEHEAQDRVLVASGDMHPPIARFRLLSGGRIATSASNVEVRNFVLSMLFRTAGRLRPAYDALQVPETYHGLRIVSPAMLTIARRFDLDVHVWTIDEPGQMRRLLGWGVDGVMSDRPDLLARELVREGI